MFDNKFMEQLYKFYSFDTDVRRTGRTTMLAKVLLQVALNSGREIRYDIDHYIDARGMHPSSDEVIRRIEQLTTEIRRESHIEIRLSVNRQRRSFSAVHLGHSLGEPLYIKGIDPYENKSNRKLLMLTM